MIQQLSQLGKTLRNELDSSELIHNAIKDEPISIELIISETGNFEKFELIEKIMTKAEAITAKKGKARLLLDKAEEVLGFGGEKSVKKHELYHSKLEEYKELPELMPVFLFYKENRENGIEQALANFEASIPDEKNRGGNIGFRIIGEGIRIHQKPEVLKQIILKYDQEQKQKLSATSKNCSICGKCEYPVEDIPHGMIKRVPDGQSSGCALVSYNENAFESYDLKGNNNSAICTNCSKTYVEGLNWLLTNGTEITIQNKKGKEEKRFQFSNRKKLGNDTAMVFWTRNNSEVPEIDWLEQPDEGLVRAMLESIASGTVKNSRYLDTDLFYACSLSGSAARIAVRDWIETSLPTFKTAIAQWFQDIAMSQYDKDLGKSKREYTGIYFLARTTQNKTNDKDVTHARTATHLWNAAIKNTTLPRWILTKVLYRARMDGVTTAHAAMIKLILNRESRKKGGYMITETLDTTPDRPIAYVCGQIFAKLESIQHAAIGDRNAGIRERYFTYAMTTPGAAFGRLFHLNSKHFTKLKSDKPGLAVNLDKELQALCKHIDIAQFPKTFLLEEQGQFAIGYYHQRQAQFTKEEK